MVIGCLAQGHMGKKKLKIGPECCCWDKMWHICPTLQCVCVCVTVLLSACVLLHPDYDCSHNFITLTRWWQHSRTPCLLREGMYPFNLWSTHTHTYTQSHTVLTSGAQGGAKKLNIKHNLHTQRMYICMHRYTVIQRYVELDLLHVHYFMCACACVCVCVCVCVRAWLHVNASVPE